MNNYLELMHKIQKEGSYKPAARANMPGTYSLFGEQLKFNLQDGFPIVTTKKVSFKNIVTELLWFLKGDTNIKYLVDNGCNIWNEDAYNYYNKILKRHDLRGEGYTFHEFVVALKEQGAVEIVGLNGSDYKLGDCGKQYGWLWRNWTKPQSFTDFTGNVHNIDTLVDQLKDLIEGLKTNPMSRRHIITAWNPATLDDMALNACHAFVQFNCRRIPVDKQINYMFKPDESEKGWTVDKDRPQYYLDCQLYQRSADYILG